MPAFGVKVVSILNSAAAHPINSASGQIICELFVLVLRIENIQINVNECDSKSPCTAFYQWADFCITFSKNQCLTTWTIHRDGICSAYSKRIFWPTVMFGSSSIENCKQNIISCAANLQTSESLNLRRTNEFTSISIYRALFDPTFCHLLQIFVPM